MKNIFIFLLLPLALFAMPATLPLQVVNTEMSEYVIPEKINNYFQLATKEDLQWFSDTVNHGGYTLNAKLIADIDFESDYWIPIAVGNGDNCYAGTFDGNNFTVSNLVLDTKWLKDYYNIQNSGFIGSSKGTLKNLTLDNITVYSKANGGLGSTNPSTIIEKAVSAGSAVGWLNGGTVNNVTVTGNMSAIGTGVALGGIVGNAGGGKIINSTSSVIIRSNSDTSTVYIGGIVGYTKKTPTLQNDIWNGEIIENTGKGTSGGIAGYVYNGTVTIDNVTFNHEGVENAIGKSCDACKVSGDVDYGVYKIYMDGNKKICELNGTYKGKTADGIFMVKDNVDSVVFNRKFNPGKYSTISLPFSISVTDIEGATFYRLYDVVRTNGSYVVQVTEEKNEIVANKPYIVITDGTAIGIKGSYGLNNAPSDTSMSTDRNWLLTSVHKYTTGADLGERRAKAYGFAAKDTIIDGISWAAGQFARLGERAYIYPFRVYLEYIGEELTALAKSAREFAGPIPETIDIEVIEDPVKIFGPVPAFNP